MSPADFADLQEALLYVFAPVLVVLCGLAFTGGLLAAIVSITMQILTAKKRGF